MADTMWIDADGVAHTVALPNPVDVMSPEFRASFDLVLSGGRDVVELMLGLAEERVFGEDLSALADPEKESVFEGLTPPGQLRDGDVHTPDEVMPPWNARTCAGDLMSSAH